MFVVKLTFKRIQEFLFAVPRLKAMIGANALLGETIRNELTDKVVNGMNVSGYSAPVADEGDPLDKTDHRDDPSRLYQRGILSRDGGHFHAIFQKKEDAQAFIAKAREEVGEKLPGVLMEARMQTLDGEAVDMANESPWGESDTRLPLFQICQDTGKRVANYYRKIELPPYISYLVKQLENKGDAFYEGNTKEIIGLLWEARQLPSLDYDARIPEDLEELSGAGGYIAVIHADGNGMGNRRTTYAGASEGKIEDLDAFMKQEVANETFFHAMRVAVRKAVKKALHEVFTPDVLKSSYKLPYQLLMLGGDDLLLVTRPEYAFPFVIAYAEALEKLPIPYKGEEKRPMSIGAGIAIASHKLPFHHLYDLAESLAGSAKKLFRAQKGNDDGNPPERSVVDWMVSTSSWVEDVEKTRQEINYARKNGTQYCTSGKPYFILPNENDTDTFNLKNLFEKASELAGTYEQDEKGLQEDRHKIARSQMKRLLQPVSRFDEEGSNKLFANMTGVPECVKNLFQKDNLWLDLKQERKLTQFNDFMELVEIHYLGRKKKATDKQRLDPESEGDERAAGGQA